MSDIDKLAQNVADFMDFDNDAKPVVKDVTRFIEVTHQLLIALDDR